MALTVRRTGAEDYGRYIKALICGDPGAGKTLISSTFPNPLYASAEGGLMSVADRNIPYVEVRSSDDLMEIKNSLHQDPEMRESILGFPVDTVVIDTIDEIQNILKAERMKDTKRQTFELKDWQWLDEQMRAIVRAFRNMNMHVVFTCHLKETNDGEGTPTRFVPKLQGSISSGLPGYVDLSLLLSTNLVNDTVDGKLVKREERILRTSPDNKYPFLKDRSGKLDREIPVNFQDDFERMNNAIFSHVHLRDRVEYDVDTPGEPKDEGLLSPEEVVEVPASETSNEPTVSSRNKLPEGVVAIPLGHDTNIFCVECGNELESERQAEISRIKCKRKILCQTHQDDATKPKKGSK